MNTVTFCICDCGNSNGDIYSFLLNFPFILNEICFSNNDSHSLLYDLHSFNSEQLSFLMTWPLFSQTTFILFMTTFNLQKLLDCTIKKSLLIQLCCFGPLQSTILCCKYQIIITQ